MKTLALAALLLPQLALAGIGTGGKHFQRVITVVLENTSYAEATKMPFLSSLAARGALLANFHAEAHPSQANYVALISGTTERVRGDDPVNLSTSHIGDLLDATRRDWRVYVESWPGNCFLGPVRGTYFRKHNPFISFTNIQRDQARCAKIVAGSQFQADAAQGLLPAYSFFIPDINNDGHDTTPAFADHWLETQFGSYINNDSLMGGTLFVVTFDENDDITDMNNQVFTMLYGPMVLPGTVVNDRLSHYSLLRMVEDNWDLGNFGRGDSTASVISGIWAD